MSDDKARKVFELWCKEGVKPLWYDLTQCANSEYVSPYTEFAWKAFKAGWFARWK